MLTVNQHLSSFFILRVLYLLKVTLVDVELYVEDRGLCFVFILARRDVGEVRTGLEKGSQGVNHKEYYENVVEVKTALLLLLALGLTAVAAK
jgi:hypothetical protein